ncbi:MAG TPA: cyanophycinase [Terriglobales bacterium]|nr:cyanophycinase [Terriglobales bacterium]
MQKAAGRLTPLALAALALAAAAQTPYRYVRAGNPHSRAAAPRGGFALMGGGTDLDAAFQMCQRSGGGDFLILRASGTAAYNPYIESRGSRRFACRQNRRERLRNSEGRPAPGKRIRRGPCEAQRRLGAAGPPSRREHKRDARRSRAGARANHKLCPQVNSVSTLILPSRAAALAPFASRAIAQASAIFIAGGDQSNYINFWRHTPVARALDAAIRRGVPLGGTSAGLAVLGEFAYSAQHDPPNGPDLTAAAALANPFHPQVVLVRGFLAIPALREVVTDTHFHNRNRLGRLLVFMARILQAGDAARIHGLGID